MLDNKTKSLAVCGPRFLMGLGHLTRSILISPFSPSLLSLAFSFLIYTCCRDFSGPRLPCGKRSDC